MVHYIISAGNNMNFKELDRQAREIFELYNRTVFIRFTLKEEDDNLKLYYTINYVLESMDEEYQFLIRKEYIEHAPHHWWQLFYSRTTYYRLKRKALTDLLARLKW